MQSIRSINSFIHSVAQSAAHPHPDARQGKTNKRDKAMDATGPPARLEQEALYHALQPLLLLALAPTLVRAAECGMWRSCQAPPRRL